MDPDDYYPSEDVLESLYEAAKKREAVVVGGRLYEFCDNPPTAPFEHGSSVRIGRDCMFSYRN